MNKKEYMNIKLPYRDLLLWYRVEDGIERKSLVYVDRANSIAYHITEHGFVKILDNHICVNSSNFMDLGFAVEIFDEEEMLTTNIKGNSAKEIEDFKEVYTKIAIDCKKPDTKIEIKDLLKVQKFLDNGYQYKASATKTL